MRVLERSPVITLGEASRGASAAADAAHNETILVGGERHKIEEISCKPCSGIIEYRMACR